MAKTSFQIEAGTTAADVVGIDAFTGELPAGIGKIELDGAHAVLRGAASEPFRESVFGPVSFPGVERWMVLALKTHFFSEPVWADSTTVIPAKSQFLLGRCPDGRVLAVFPLIDGDCHTDCRGGEGGLEFVCSTGEAGRPVREIDLALLAYGEDPYAVVESGARQACRRMGKGRMRVEKKAPEWMDHLGWCSWDAFYEDYDEPRILNMLEQFKSGGLVPGHIILDQGWLDYGTDYFLNSFGVKAGAFRDDSLRHLAAQAKETFGVKMVGCWRTLFGELRGVSVDSEALASFRRKLVQEPGTEDDWFGVVMPEDVVRFHDAYAEHLAGQGIDFLKVDYQSALKLMTYEDLGRGEAVSLWQEALQGSVERHMGGELLNCMAMATDEVYHSRRSNVVRSSDDYFPNREQSHACHVAMNLWNTLWVGEWQWADWDMFHSDHPWGRYHALARTLSGGPVYVSDRPGGTDFDLLKQMVAADGKLLRCDRPARPTADILFRDPLAEGLCLRGFNYSGAGGVLGIFHPDGPRARETLREGVTATEVEGLDAEATYAVHSSERGFLGTLKGATALPVQLEPRGAELLSFAPVEAGIALLGLVDKLNPLAALGAEADGQRTIRGGGRFGLYADAKPARIRLDDTDVPFEWDAELGWACFDTGERPTARLVVVSASGSEGC